MDWRAQMENDPGGPDTLSAQQRALIEVACRTRLFLEAIRNPAIHGICNATGLQPVTNAEFMETLRRTLRVPFGLPAPDWLVRLGAPLLDTDPDLALNGRRGLPCRIHGLGFRFRHHELRDALADLLLPRPAEAREREWVGTFAR